MEGQNLERNNFHSISSSFSSSLSSNLLIYDHFTLFGWLHGHEQYLLEISDISFINKTTKQILKLGKRNDKACYD